MRLNMHIGMRKVKSLLSVIVAFLVWQGIRLFLPMLDVHPLFAYIYAVIEMRDTPEKTKKFGALRIRATFVGLVIGLIFIAVSAYVAPLVSIEWLRIFVEFAFILIAVLCALCLAEVAKCETFCGIAAIIAVICMISHSEEDIYLYAIMRVVQTLIGIFSAMLINVLVRRKEIEKTPDENQGKG